MDKPISPFVGYGVIFGAMFLALIVGYARVRYLQREYMRYEREKRDASIGPDAKPST